MSSKQITVLWLGFATYAIIVLWEPVRWFRDYDLSWLLTKSFKASYGYGALILVVTVLVCMTVGWYEKKKKGRKDGG